MDGSIGGRSAPSVWRGQGAGDGDPGRTPEQRRTKASLLGTLGREIMEHPAETAALVTMALALSRVLPRSGAALRSGSPRSRRRGAILPLGLMAALCIIGLSG
jgi:hypothetical protein